MGIEALPQATVRVLGASQVLTDPSAVVKELLDNAYDANATSIAVEISSNTVDVIQVRDNGHGIAPGDRALIARRYCTSKISHDDELKDIGGSSLGFRGEALASAAELSGSITISTRIEGEQVAAALNISQQGEVVGQEKASLPVGTTVRITDFIKANPVRRQVVLKGTENCLKKIKRTLQAYAFARPHVRLSLRVLKAKNTKGDWVYAPKVNGNAEDASFKVVGAACASQCMWSVTEMDGFYFQAFLPRLDADASKISNIGSFISVDARPVSAARGIFKQISKIFREALRKGDANMVDVKDPFLYLEIQCPRGSYDANLEPAKDDLLFEDADKFVDTARKLFSTAYESQEADAEVLRPETSDTPRQQLQQDLDDIASSTLQRAPLQARDEHPKTDATLGMTTKPFHLGDLTTHDADLRPRGTYRSTMYGCDEEDLEFLDQRPSTGHNEDDFAELRRFKKDMTVSNPWIAAKLHASVRRPASAADDTAVESDRVRLLRVATSSSPLKQSTLGLTALPTPRPSSPLAVPNEGFHSDHVPDIRLARNGRLVGSSALPQPQLYTPSPSVSTHRGPEYHYTPTSDPPRGTPLGAIPDISTRPRRSPRKARYQDQLNRPFVSPMIDESPRENVWFDHLQDVERPRASPKRRRQNFHGDTNGLVAQGVLGDLLDDPRAMTPPRRNRDIRDFVDRQADDSTGSMIEPRTYQRPPSTAHRSTPGNVVPDLTGSAETDAEHRPQLGFVPASKIMGLEESVGSLDQRSKNALTRRRTGERRALLELDSNAGNHSVQQEMITFDEDEYRPENAKRKLSRRKSSNKLSRNKSSRLPLERIPAGKGTHDLSFTCSISSIEISRLAGKHHIASSLLGFNEPGMPATYGMDWAASNLLSLTASLHGLLASAGGYEDIAGPSALLSEVKAAFAQRDAASSLGFEDEMLMSSGT